MGNREESLNLEMINQLGWNFLAGGYIEHLFPGGKWKKNNIYKPLNPWRVDKNPGSFVIDVSNQYAKDFACDFFTKKSPVVYSYGTYGVDRMTKQEYAAMAKEFANIAGLTSACHAPIQSFQRPSPKIQKKERPYKPPFNPHITEKILMCRKKRVVEKNEQGEFISKPVLISYEYVRGYLVCRFPDEPTTGKDGIVKMKKDFRPQYFCEEEKTWMFKDPPSNEYYLPLYRLDQILADQENRKILVGEGEKVADFLQLIFPSGLATTSSHGARSAWKTSWEATKGHEVIIFPDHDDAGILYALDVVELCQQAGASKIKIVMYEQHDDGWDVADYVPIEEVRSGKSVQVVIDDKGHEVEPTGCLNQIKSLFKEARPGDILKVKR